MNEIDFEMMLAADDGDAFFDQVDALDDVRRSED
jgi:hypothetical protein